jgi:hypothetical protein
MKVLIGIAFLAAMSAAAQDVKFFHVRSVHRATPAEEVTFKHNAWGGDSIFHTRITVGEFDGKLYTFEGLDDGWEWTKLEVGKDYPARLKGQSGIEIETVRISKGRRNRGNRGTTSSPSRSCRQRNREVSEACANDGVLDFAVM